ncbi:hypothetical protein SYNTR_0049 [Candidatus Syntrophocurvum alkaliphilum]|uniref:Uncharacterized protein n=1 Tax=Candidatus Syntrophocurvum alkaliphilum TaxID=2293317 RepID=A0A6I6DCM1_9FIRM|nr:DUF190 domain-containing protein [Candidatus Syntrophocurvum alkaliphilum]QGT98642.1 hypothetical protein SYNTR_0049 [Candidatus Syntrophocurvum alkaliphilum]
MGKFKFSGPAKRLRIYIGEQAKYKGISLYHALVLKAKEMDMAGITVIKGIEGFGANVRIQTSRLVELSSDLPIIVEVVDSTDYIDNYILAIEHLIEDGLVTIDDVEIIKYSSYLGGRLKRLQRENE